MVRGESEKRKWSGVEKKDVEKPREWRGKCRERREKEKVRKNVKKRKKKKEKKE